MKNKLHKIVLLLSLISIIIMEIKAFIITIGSLGMGIIIYYTEISNLITFFSAIVGVIFVVISFRKNNVKFPSWLSGLRFLSSTMLLMTMLITIFVLVPYSPHMMNSLLFSGYGLFHHTLIPVISICSYIFLEPHYNKKKTLFIPLVATLIYGVIMILLNILRLFSGPYPFFKVYNQPVLVSLLWFTGLPLLVVGFAAFIYFAALKWDKVLHKGK